MTSGTQAQAAGTARPAPSWMTIALRIVGPGLLIASGAIHLDLYLTGYRSIPTIGWLFLFQVIAAFALGLAAAGLRTWLAAAAAAAFSLATLGGYILALWIGLFGFKEVRTSSGIAAAVLEVAAFATLAALALSRGPAPATTAAPAPTAAPTAAASPAAGPGRAGLAAWLAGPPAWVPVKAAGMAAAGLAVVALALLGVSLAGAGGAAQPAAAPGALKTAAIGGSTVLTNAKGLTLYWFAPDTPAMSKCYGDCAAYWPPVPGHATAGPGVTGRLGTIQRTGGTTQATYDGHPLYTYVGDSGPGQDSGNNLNLNGGLWHVVPVSGG